MVFRGISGRLLFFTAVFVGEDWSCRVSFVTFQKMGWFYRHAVRPLLFAQESETVHNQTIRCASVLSRSSIALRLIEAMANVPECPVELFGLQFPNPIGLAAGMDKQGMAVPFWKAIGFGFSELGGVTWHAQPGNPKPRMFRAISDEALVNRMGFNNTGAPALADRLRNWRGRSTWPGHPVGINLGKSKITPLKQAADDYANSFRVLHELGDFFVVNVSSPNTPNLRQLQDKSALDEILSALQELNAYGTDSESESGRVTSPRGTIFGRKPILVKVAPDLSFTALDEILELVGPRGIAGIVATNTTVARPSSRDAVCDRIYHEMGGLSGRPLRERSTEIIRHLYQQTCGKVPIVGVGGISSFEDAWEKISAGASLVQIYSGLVYRGPELIREIAEGLRERVGTASWMQVVGSE